MDHFDRQTDSEQSDSLPVQACVGPQFRLSFLGILDGGFSLKSPRCEAQREVMVNCAQADEQLRLAQAMSARGQERDAIVFVEEEALPAARQCLASVDRLALFAERHPRDSRLSAGGDHKTRSNTEKPDYCRVFPQQSQCI